MKKTLEESLSEQLVLEEGKPLQKCARFFGFLAVYMLIVIIGFWFCESYIRANGFQGDYIAFILFKFMARVILMIPVAAILSRCYRSFKKEEAYVSCLLLKTTGFSVILCILGFSFIGTIQDLSAELSLVICSAVCMFIYSVFLDSNFLRRGALIYCIVSMVCFMLNIFIFYEIYISIKADSEAIITFNKIFEWVSFMIIALAVAFGYLITMIGILQKNKELARAKANNIN